MANWYHQLRKLTGYSEFKPGQLETLNNLSEDLNVIAILPTGGGKSLIYQLYQYESEGVTIIISPLIALMQDQVAQLQCLGINRAIALNSQQSSQEKAWIIHHLSRYQFVFLSPEMFQQPEVFQAIKKLQINLLVIDEAHCISQWGIDFRPEYSELGKLRKRLNNPLTLALSATANQNVRYDIQRFLFQTDEKVSIIQEDINRDNIFYAKVETSEEQRLPVLIEWINQLPKPGIIYVHNKEELEALKQTLIEVTDWQIESYHADRSDHDRYIIQQQFRTGLLDIILATSAFGMGINQKNIRFVIHYHLPTSVEELIQEDGRCGRDGKQSLALWLVTPNEIGRLSTLKVRNKDSYQEMKQLLQTSYNHPEHFNPIKNQLSEYYQAVLRFYTQHFNQFSQAEKHLESYYQSQQEKISQVQQLLSTKQCLRKQLLYSQDNTPSSEQTRCCSNCDSTFLDSDWFQLYKKRSKRAPKWQRQTWRERLDQLLG